MNIKTTAKVSGQLNFLRVIRKGEIVKEIGPVKNILRNNAFSANGGLASAVSSFALSTNGDPNHRDLDGTWNQTGNVVTRATGSGTFPSSPSSVNNEIRFASGERCHIVSRQSNTQVTVSGPPRTITGQAVREYFVNTTSIVGTVQTSVNIAPTHTVDDVNGVKSITYADTLPSATAAYTLRSVGCMTGRARVLLPESVEVELDDQVQLSYTASETVTNRSQIYELGSESVGLPQKYPITSIAGDGTNVDVTFDEATHFLAGDKLDLRNIVPRRFAISSASSTSTTITIETSAAHGLSVSDEIVVEGASVEGYNGSFTVATVPNSTTITITDASDPGAMGASGTVRLQTPANYFDTLGLAEIASMVSTSVARITSSVQGPAVDLAEAVGGDPGVTVKVRRIPATVFVGWDLANAGTAHLLPEGSANAIMDELTIGNLSDTGSTAVNNSSVSFNNQNSAAANDFVVRRSTSWSAGAGTGVTRAKQIHMRFESSNNTGSIAQVTFNTPFTKSDAQRVRFFIEKQIQRELDLTGLP